MTEPIAPPPPPDRFAAAEEWFFETAREATGLSDFGDTAFLPHLRVLLRAYDEEAHLSPLGRQMVTGELLTILKNRLVVQDHWNRKPAILKGTIQRPIFIIGLPRSGTTALHFLLAQDPDNQVLEYWLAAAPGPRPPVSEWAADPRFQEAVHTLEVMYQMDPGLKAIHLMTADGPDECRHLFLQSFLDDTFDSNATIPSYTTWFAAQDMHPAYLRHRDILKLIQSSGANRRWALKYPAHMRNLRTLLDVYPDACIVQTHRDPSRVLPSICSLVAGWRGLYEEGVDRHAIGRWQLDMWATLIETALAVRKNTSPEQFYDFSFAELIADPVAALQRMYAYFGFDLSAEAERRMRAWYADNPQGKHGGHQYRAEDFGLSEGAITERFADYLKKFAVPTGAGA